MRFAARQGGQDDLAEPLRAGCGRGLAAPCRGRSRPGRTRLAADQHRATAGRWPHHARAAHDTVHGRVEAAWRIDGEDMAVDVTVPTGTTATVALPLHTEGACAEVGPGSHSWRYPLPETPGAAR
ncbi:alpha-L-rhamnosidase C-terminal domain-containing protein [Saccharothrix deserti]|uniref:alpha-L-rhamnosidase C-terminal domain-containing protein n=1 Tax=Saccharothrix deserti TaxID=2593674 RepID=UPI00192E31F4|nr:alpha-L-rhamnosidase C-terminal domain-containing protein [Saccharothrix deserti]